MLKWVHLPSFDKWRKMSANGGLEVAPQKNAAASDGNKTVVIALVVTIVLVVMLILL